MKKLVTQKEMRHEPIQARSAKRVEQILNCASQLFSEIGYDRATTNDIAKRAGVPIGSVYQYFPNKDALLHALTKRYLLQLKSFFADRMKETERYFSLYLSFHNSRWIDRV